MEIGESQHKNEELPLQEQKEMGGFVIRSVGMQDCDDMAAVWNSLVEEKAPIGRQTFKKKEQQQEDLEKIIAGIEKGEVVYNVAEKDGHVVGWASVIKAGERENRKVGVLGVITLGKNARGKGMAGKLLEKTIEDAQRVLGIGEVELETFAFNASARKLYAKHGFVETGRVVPLKNYYGKDLERVEMRKVL